MEAVEELKMRGITKCPECDCAVDDDWGYKDLSYRTIVICPQCKSEFTITEVDE